MLATVEQYVERYGAVTDEARVKVLLEDASNLMLSAYEAYWGEAYVEDAHTAFDRAAAAVCCKLVHNALTAPEGYEGATQFSQGAGGYTASVTFGGAVGDMWLGKTDLATLGLTRQRRRVLTPEERDEVTDDA